MDILDVIPILSGIAAVIDNILLPLISKISMVCLTTSFWMTPKRARNFVWLIEGIRNEEKENWRHKTLASFRHQPLRTENDWCYHFTLYPLIAAKPVYTAKLEIEIYWLHSVKRSNTMPKISKRRTIMDEPTYGSQTSTMNETRMVSFEETPIPLSPRLNSLHSTSSGSLPRTSCCRDFSQASQFLPLWDGRRPRGFRWSGRTTMSWVTGCHGWQWGHMLPMGSIYWRGSSYTGKGAFAMSCDLAYAVWFLINKFLPTLLQAQTYSHREHEGIPAWFPTDEVVGALKLMQV
jgi:hypothetical protein